MILTIQKPLELEEVIFPEGYRSDVNAFLQKCEEGDAIRESNANRLNQHIIDIDAAGFWASTVALYVPTVARNSWSRSFNVKNPNLYRMTFGNNAPAHPESGIRFNGNQWANQNIYPRTALPGNNYTIIAFATEMDTSPAEVNRVQGASWDEEPVLYTFGPRDARFKGGGEINTTYTERTEVLYIGTRGNTNSRIYIEGELKAEKTDLWADALLVSQRSLYMGALHINDVPQSEHRFKGTIAYWMMLNRYTTTEEAQTLTTLIRKFLSK